MKRKLEKGKQVLMAAQEQEPSRTSLETKIEVVRVQLDGISGKMNDFMGEQRRWWTEFKGDIVDRVTRVENQTLEGGKMVVMRLEALERTAAKTEETRNLDARLEALEKKDVGSMAIDNYKRWLIGLAVGFVSSMLLNIINVIKFFQKIP